MGWFQAILLGLVQGITEFLPVSSSGHLAILQNLGMENIEETHMFFDVLLHLGTLVAVCIFYWKDIVEMCRALWSMIKALFTGGKQKSAPATEGRPVEASKGRLAIMIIVATLPLILVLFVQKYIAMLGTSTRFVGLMLIITGGILYFSDKLVHGKKGEKTMTVTDALMVGLAQCVGTLPGISRSGVTITAGMCCGFSRSFSVRFSFLMSIPAILGANIVSLFSSLDSVDWALMPRYLVGTIVAGVVGYFAIRLVKYLVSANHFGKFAYYCWGLGALALLILPFFTN